MKLRFLTLLSTVVLLASCGDNASSRIKKENVAKLEQEAAAKKALPVMTFEKTKHNFGEMIEGDVVNTTFTFKNTGKSPLIITNARASCGCTIPDYPRQPIKVGEEGIIKVKFNSRGKHGKQNKRVILTTNTEKGREMVYILANVSKKEK